MSLQLHKTIHKFIIRTTYYYSLILGITPGLYDWPANKFKFSKLYLIYSAVIQLSFLAITPLTSPYIEQENNYMENKPILQWTYLVGKVARILTIVVISVKVWLARHSLINIIEMYTAFREKYRYFFQYFRSNIEAELLAEEKRLQHLMFYKFTSVHINSLAIHGMFLQMQEKPGQAYFIMVSMNLMQTFYLLVANLQFMLILNEIHLKFFYINTSLEAMRKKRFPAQVMLNNYLILYEMYMDCFELSNLCFQACNDVTMFMLIKIFTTNVVILYHAVLMMMSSIRSDNLVNLIGTLCIVNFYWDSFLITMANDNALTSCNRRTAEILKATWITLDDVGKDVRVYKELMEVLNQFSDYLACNKLQFCIYGLVNFDKASSFQYFVAALLHLIILVQFDLKNRLQPENQTV